MDARTVAKDALEIFKAKEESFMRMDYIAVMGFLEGVADGRLTIGQSWLGAIFRKLYLNETERIRTGVLDDKEEAVVKNLFSYGLCSSGQQFEPLAKQRGKTFKERVG